MLNWHAQVLSQAQNIQYDYQSRMAGMHAAAARNDPHRTSKEPEEPEQYERASDASNDRKITRLRSEVDYYRKLSVAAQSDADFWEKAVEEREGVIENLRGELSEAEHKLQQIKEENDRQGPSRLEKIQAAALAEKDHQLSTYQEEATATAERLSAAELAAVEMKNELEALKKEYRELSEASERKATEHRTEAEANSARIMALERQVTKRADEVSSLKEQLVGWDPQTASKLEQMQRSLSEVQKHADAAEQAQDELKELRQRCFGYEHEVTQLQKQRRHLDRRLTDALDKVELLEEKLARSNAGVTLESGPTRVEESAGLEDEEDEPLQGNEAEYAELLQEAYNTNLRHIEAMKFIGITAKNINQLPVVVLAPGNVANKMDQKQVVMFVLRFLEDLEIFHSKYTVVYCDTDLAGSLRVDTMELLGVLRSLPTRAKNNLANLWVLHPSTTARTMMSSVQTLFGDSAIEQKIEFVDSIAHLADQMWQRRIVLPDYTYRKEGLQPGGLARGLDQGPGVGTDLMVKNRRLLWNETITRQQRKRRSTLLQRDKESLEYFHDRHRILMQEKRYEEAQYVEEDIGALEAEIHDLEVAIASDN